MPSASSFYTLQKRKVRKSARLIADAASNPYSENYYWWYMVDYVKRILVVGFASFEQRTNVRNILCIYCNDQIQAISCKNVDDSCKHFTN